MSTLAAVPVMHDLPSVAVRRLSVKPIFGVIGTPSIMVDPPPVELPAVPGPAPAVPVDAPPVPVAAPAVPLPVLPLPAATIGPVSPEPLSQAAKPEAIAKTETPRITLTAELMIQD